MDLRPLRHAAAGLEPKHTLSPCGPWISVASVAVRPNQAIIAFAGSSPPSPLRHVAGGLDGGRPGEGKDFLERGGWQPFWQETIVCIHHSRFPSLHRKECVDLLRLLQLVFLGLGNKMP